MLTILIVIASVLGIFITKSMPKTTPSKYISLMINLNFHKFIKNL